MVEIFQKTGIGKYNNTGSISWRKRMGERDRIALEIILVKVWSWNPGWELLSGVRLIERVYKEAVVYERVSIKPGVFFLGWWFSLCRGCNDVASTP
jgi:hypothetical protein